MVEKEKLEQAFSGEEEKIKSENSKEADDSEALSKTVETSVPDLDSGADSPTTAASGTRSSSPNRDPISSTTSTVTMSTVDSETKLIQDLQRVSLGVETQRTCRRTCGATGLKRRKSTEVEE